MMRHLGGDIHGMPMIVGGRVMGLLLRVGSDGDQVVLAAPWRVLAAMAAGAVLAVALSALLILISVRELNDGPRDQ